jgi:hypothetical protein
MRCGDTGKDEDAMGLSMGGRYYKVSHGEA